MDTLRTHSIPRRSRARRVLAISSLVVLAVVAACTTDPTERSGPEGGWLDGSPAAADAAHTSAGEFGAASDELMADGDSSSRADAAAAVEITEEVEAAGLRAGSVNDNADFAGYLAYRERFAELGIPVRELDVSVRHVVSVVGADGRPALGEPVEVFADGAPIGAVRTGADGRALVHPLALGAASDAVIEVRVAGATQVPDADGSTTFALDRAGGADAPVALDLFFLLDATGSMGDELRRLTETVDQVAERIAALDTQPDVRIGMTVYRDEGDAFVTRTFDFTGDVASFRSALGEVEAAGGGDLPEALDEALAAGLAEPSWRDPADTVQLAFVVADAPPQVARDVPMPYDVALLEVAARGIRIHTVGATGTDDAAEYVFRQFAQFSGGRFVFLSHGVEGAALGPSTDISSVDYEELPLEDLLVRLVSEELDHLADPDQPPVTTITAPTTTAPTTTAPTTTMIDPAQRQPG